MDKHKAKKMRAALRKAGCRMVETPSGLTLWKHPKDKKVALQLTDAYNKMRQRETRDSLKSQAGYLGPDLSSILWLFIFMVIACLALGAVGMRTYQWVDERLDINIIWR